MTAIFYEIIHHKLNKIIAHYIIIKLLELL